MRAFGEDPFGAPPFDPKALENRAGRPGRRRGSAYQRSSGRRTSRRAGALASGAFEPASFAPNSFVSTTFSATRLDRGAFGPEPAEAHVQVSTNRRSRSKGKAGSRPTRPSRRTSLLKPNILKMSTLKTRGSKPGRSMTTRSARNPVTPRPPRIRRCAADGRCGSARGF